MRLSLRPLWTLKISQKSCKIFGSFAGPQYSFGIPDPTKGSRTDFPEKWVAQVSGREGIQNILSLRTALMVQKLQGSCQEDQEQHEFPPAKGEIWASIRKITEQIKTHQMYLNTLYTWVLYITHKKTNKNQIGHHRGVLRNQFLTVKTSKWWRESKRLSWVTNSRWGEVSSHRTTELISE